MDYFTLIEDRAVLLRSNGVYKQAKAYRRGESLFAGHGSGFVKLLAKPGTSNPNVLWDETDADHGHDALGRPIVKS